MLDNRLSRIHPICLALVAATGFAVLPASAASPSASGDSTATTSVTTAGSDIVSPTTVTKAAAFVNSVGVGVHFDRGAGPYTNYAQVKQALLNLGIHHIRDSLTTSDAAKYRDLAAAGIKTSGTVPRENDTDAELAKSVDLAASLGSSLSSIAGPNEYETTVTGWVSKLRSIQSRLYSMVNNKPALDGLHVLGPSLQTATNESLLGNISGILDDGAIHAYPYGQMPEDKAASYLAEARVTSGSKPIVVSETGMANASDALRKKYDLPYSERAAQIYTPRLVLEYFRLGVVRTFLYELVNEDNVAGIVPRGRYFGLMYKDFTPKPSYLAIRNMLVTLADTTRNFTTKPLNYSISSSAGLREMLFQKSDGSYYIAVWRPVSVWQPGAARGHDLFPAATAATLNLPSAAASVQVIDINRGLTPVQTARNTQHVRLNVLPSVQLVKVTM